MEHVKKIGRLEKVEAFTAKDVRHKYYGNTLLNNLVVEDAFDFAEVYCRAECEHYIEPHRLAFYKAFIVTEGGGSYELGNKTVKLSPGTLGFVSPETIRSWTSESSKQAGYTLMFSEDFLLKTMADKDFLLKSPLFQITEGVLLQPDKNWFEEALGIFKKLHKLQIERPNLYRQKMRSLTEYLLIGSQAEHKETTSIHDHERAALRLLEDFTRYYMKGYAPLKVGKPIELKPVDDYAEKLQVSRNHLNDSVKKLTGKSAGQLIAEQTIAYAGMCLKQSHKTISEIAFLFGYDDPSYFARVYKKHTGLTPSQARAKM